MREQIAALAAQDRYRLLNCTVPAALTGAAPADRLINADIIIANGRIEAVGVAGEAGIPSIDLRQSLVLPGFVDLHTHLDKGHISPRQPNPDGTFMGALFAVRDDREKNWSEADVRRRMDFALRCAYAHGTVAIRTHLDSVPPQEKITWPLFAEMRQEWKDRIALQGVALMGIDHMLDLGVLTGIATQAKKFGGILGGAMASQPRMAEALRQTLEVADRLELEVDVHLDETQDHQSDALRALAEAVLETGFSRGVTAGHCCSLSRQDDDEAKRTIELVARAGINIVTLPMCNMYLQDRRIGAVTPRFRGVTLVRELLAAGVNVSSASDNTRDPFYAYGDLDCLEVLRETVRIAHLDHPVDIAPALVTRNPAKVMGLNSGELVAGRTADLVLLTGRDWSEVLSRPESGRTILRSGKPINAALPDYRELDDLVRN